MAESTDRLLSGRYRLIERIGRGGMGTVWWAHDEVSDREVAVKEVHLPPSLDAREHTNLVKRTHREALAAGRLHHPGLITVHDVLMEGARPYLVMEYVPARSLEDVLTEDGPISPQRVAAIGCRLLDGLRAAHEAGIVHRDVKPSNVLLGNSGRVVLTDFGIATYEGATTLTQSGTFMGSPAYVAPEVAQGGRATPASDLWSLGATLYAAVEGRPPYDHETAMATLSALISSEPDAPLSAGPLRPVLDGLLRKEPARRLNADRAAELLAAAARPDEEPMHDDKDRGFLQRLPHSALTAAAGGLVAVAAAAGIIAAAESGGGDGDENTPVPPQTSKPSASPSAGAQADLPKTITGRSGTTYERAATKSGQWPATTTVTLRVSRPGRSVGVVVLCKGAGKLRFTVDLIGLNDSGPGATCTHQGAKPRPAFALINGTVSRVTVQVRVSGGGGAPAGKALSWTAVAYRPGR